MKFIFFLLAIITIKTSLAQINIVPMPAEIHECNEKTSFVLSSKTIIVLGHTPSYKTADLLNEYLNNQYGFKLKIVTDPKYRDAENIIHINRNALPSPVPYYFLGVRKNSIALAGSENEQLFYGLQTLFQLLPKKDEPVNIKQSSGYPLSIPQLSITDYPRFPYRGMHLDVCRHFFTVAEVKKYIDFLAMYKFNTFHWHLTDDQGWRIEIKKYPLLTQVGGCRAQTLVGNYGTNKYDGTNYCGFYTQQQIKDVVTYAKERYINIIPEIEMPGHALAALASYPYLGCTKGPYKTMETWGVSDDVFCAGNDSTYRFMEDVLDEVIKLFPSKYIHVGGDECPKERWKQCPVCKAKIKSENLKDENGLQTYFVNRIGKYLSSKGRKLIGWDEILEPGLAPDATVMSWRGEEGGIAAAKQNHDVVMTPGSYCYFDHAQSANEDSITFGGYTPLEKVYAYEPVPAALSAEEAKHILGAQANLWTEYISNMSKVEYMLFPRMAALAEVLWSPKEKRSWKSFEERLPAIFNYYRDRNIHFSNAYYDLETQVVPLPGNKTGWQLKTKNKNARIIYRKNRKNENIPYDSPVAVTQNTGLEAAAIDSQGHIIGNFVKQFFNINTATGKPITLVNAPSQSYPGSGAFTLVDGVLNEKGMARSNEFLGFNGTDLDATIDLGDSTWIDSGITLNCFEQNASWIYLPESVTVFLGFDNKEFSPPYSATRIRGSGRFTVSFGLTRPRRARYVRILAKNSGIIPSGNPGAGNPAWLFVDEIEVH